jgi:hypothetical protein
MLTLDLVWDSRARRALFLSGWKVKNSSLIAAMVDLIALPLLQAAKMIIRLQPVGSSTWRNQ